MTIVVLNLRCYFFLLAITIDYLSHFLIPKRSILLKCNYKHCVEYLRMKRKTTTVGFVSFFEQVRIVHSSLLQNMGPWLYNKKGIKVPVISGPWIRIALVIFLNLK